MASNTRLYVHLMWSTWDRLPLIGSVVEGRLAAAIAAKCRELRCDPLAIGVMPDHVHLLVQIAPDLSVSDLVKGVKGSTSHLMSHEVMGGQFFKGQGSYGAFSVAPEGVSSAAAYVVHQQRHHEEGTCIGAWEGYGEDPGGLGEPLR